MVIRKLAIPLVLCLAICGCGRTATNQAQQPGDQGGTNRNKASSHAKGALAEMYYTVEESGRQWAIVIHNSPLGKYECAVPDLNGIYIRATDDKKHQISVLAFQGKVEEVKWNDKDVSAMKDVAR